MPLIVAIEPDPRQATLVGRVIRERIGGELVLVDSKDAAIAAIEKQVPDLILLTALLSPRDEEELVRHLRQLERADHLQTLTIPQLASSPAPTAERRAGRRLFGGLTRVSRRATVGCDLTVFAEEIRSYIERAQSLRAKRDTTAPQPLGTSAIGSELEPARPADAPEASAIPSFQADDASSDEAAVPTAVSLAAAVEIAPPNPEVEDMAAFAANVDVQRAAAFPADPMTVPPDQPDSGPDAPEPAAVMAQNQDSIPASLHPPSLASLEERPEQSQDSRGIVVSLEEQLAPDVPAVTPTFEVARVNLPRDPVVAGLVEEEEEEERPAGEGQGEGALAPEVEMAGLELPPDSAVAELVDEEPEETPASTSAEATAWLFSTIRALQEELRKPREAQPAPRPPLARPQVPPPSGGSSSSLGVPLESAPAPRVTRERHPAARWEPRPLPFSAWARKASLLGHAETGPPLEALLSLLRVPPQIAMVAYPRGCRIGRVRVPRRKKVRPAPGNPIVIVPRQPL